MSFARLVPLAFLLLVMTLQVEAQPGARIYRIGVLGSGSRPSPTALSPLKEGLRELGWAEGKNLVFELRYAEGVQDRLAGLAAELVNLKVDVILTYGTTAAVAARDATSTIPIVLAAVGDPVRAGLVGSLAKPGGNITGNSLIARASALKRLQLLKEAVPKARRIGAPYNPAHPLWVVVRDELESAARSIAMEIHWMGIRHADELDAAFDAAARAGVNALFLDTDPIFTSARSRVMALALKHRLPSMAEAKQFVDAGGLMSYGPNFAALHRRAAVFIDKILKGAKPGDLPIEQPTKFDLVINLKAAKALGVTVPQSLLARADEVLE